MRVEVKREWLERLRSGEYEQIQGRLRSDDGYCCMGVLCEIIDPNKWQTRDNLDWEWGYGGTKIPESVLYEIGLTEGIQRVLLKRNDGSRTDGVREHTFLEIADYIEKNL